MLKSSIKKTKEWIIRYNRIRYASFILFIFGLIDATLFPAPVATLFVLLISQFPRKTIVFTVWSISGIVSGSIISYYLGLQLADFTEGNSLHLPDFLIKIVPALTQEKFNLAINMYSVWNHWILFFASFLPIPYLIFALASGALQKSLLIFIIIVIISHLLKFMLLSLLIKKPLKLLILTRNIRIRSIPIKK